MNYNQCHKAADKIFNDAVNGNLSDAVTRLKRHTRKDRYTIVCILKNNHALLSRHLWYFVELSITGDFNR